MEKIDLKKLDKPYYSAKRKPQESTFKPHHCVAISGIGAPEGERFQHSIGTLYQVVYTIQRFAKMDEKPFVIPKLEAFWWIDEGLEFNEETKDQWQWQLMVRMPDFVTADMVDQAVEAVIKRKGNTLASEVVLKEVSQGRSIQMMHIGSYYDEERTISQLMEYMQLNGLTINGYHHEIYISDPRRTAEEKLKTIIRYAVK